MVLRTGLRPHENRPMQHHFALKPWQLICVRSALSRPPIKPHQHTLGPTTGQAQAAERNFTFKALANPRNNPPSFELLIVLVTKDKGHVRQSDGEPIERGGQTAGAGGAVLAARWCPIPGGACR